MKFKVGDRVIYTTYDGITTKGIITKIRHGGYYEIHPLSFKQERISTRIVRPEIVRLDVQYYREDRLKKLLD